jgi:hypothetical protein
LLTTDVYVFSPHSMQDPPFSPWYLSARTNIRHHHHHLSLSLSESSEAVQGVRVLCTLCVFITAVPNYKAIRVGGGG